MKIKVTKPGIYGAKGMIPVGTEFNVKEEPKGWDGRYEVISGGASGGKTAVTNPAEGAMPGAGESGAERQARLKELVGGLSEGDFIASGAPDVGKINELLNEGEKPFTAAERDQLWPGIKPAGTE